MSRDFPEPNDPSSDGLNRIEDALASLQPNEPAIDRDRLMYQAGWVAAEAAQSRRVGPRLWRAATCVSTAAALLLLVTRGEQLVTQPANQQPVVAKAETDPQEPPSEVVSSHDWNQPQVVETPPRRLPVFRAASPSPASNYLAMRQAAIEGRFSFSSPDEDIGDDADSYPTRPPATSRNLMRELLRDEQPSPAPVAPDNNARRSPTTELENVV